LPKSRTETSDKGPIDYKGASSLSSVLLNCELAFLPTTNPLLK